jgi:hypothetical protein
LTFNLKKKFTEGKEQAAAQNATQAANAAVRQHPVVPEAVTEHPDAAVDDWLPVSNLVHCEGF